MSLTDSISIDVQAMTTGVDRAQQEAAAVNHAVEQIAARARATGFTGMTTDLTRVREKIRQARSRLTETTDALGEASRAVDTVARQPSPQDTIAVLTPVLGALTTVESSVTAAAAAVDETRRLITTTLQGGQPGPTLARLQQILQILAAVRARGTTARRHVDAALAQARQVGDLGKPGLGGGSDTSGPPITPPAADDTAQQHGPRGDAGTPSGQPSTDVPRPVSPDWTRADLDTLPEGVRQAVGRFQTRPAGTTRPTLGLFNGEEIYSGGGDRSLAADLDHDPLRGPPVTFYDHAESKAAARMRRTGSVEADLAVDNTVCGSNDRDQTYPWTCDKILPTILPAGSRLHVWVTRDGGTTWWHRTYTGTGERITP